MDETMQEWEFLDYLDSKQCWSNALSGRGAHMSSYMTVPEWNNLIPAIRERKNHYSSEQWLSMLKIWDYNIYLSPNFAILAATVRRILEA